MRFFVILIIIFSLSSFIRADEYASAQELYKNRKYGAASEILKELVEKNPSKIEYRMLYGKSLLEAGYYPEAVREFEVLVTLDSENIDIFINLHRSLLAMQRNIEAENILIKGIEIFPKSHILFRNLGNFYRMEGKYEMAVNALQKSIALYPQSHLAYNLLGLAFLAKGEYRKANTAFSSAIAFSSNQAYLFNNRGVTYEKLKEYGRALADFKKGLDIDPNYTAVKENYLRVEKIIKDGAGN